MKVNYVDLKTKKELSSNIDYEGKLFDLWMFLLNLNFQIISIEIPDTFITCPISFDYPNICKKHHNPIKACKNCPYKFLTYKVGDKTSKLFGDDIFKAFMKLRFPKVKESNLYYSEWKERFDSNPLSYMDNESLDILKIILARLLKGNSIENIIKNVGDIINE